MNPRDSARGGGGIAGTIPYLSGVVTAENFVERALAFMRSAGR